jgi:PAS domain S-box-containing protein
MKKQTNILTGVASLRQKAEERLKKQQSKASLLTDETDMRKLVHELRVHQIELEMQNEELVKAKEMIEGLAKEKYKELYDFAPSGYVSLTKDGKITELNFKAAKMLGTERSQLINKRFDFLVSVDTQTTFNLFFDKVFTGKIKQTCEVTLTNKNNNAPINVHLNGVAPEDSELCQIVMVDITPLKQTTRELLLFREILQNLAEGVFMVTTSSRVIKYVNPAVEQIFGYAPHELIGKEISIVNPPVDNSSMEVAKEIIQALNKSGCWQGEIKNLRKDGTSFWSEVHILTLDDTQFGSVWVSIHSDITQRKMAEEILIQSEKTLRKEVKQRTRELKNLNVVLKKELEKRKFSEKQLKESLRSIKRLYAYVLNIREEEKNSIARIIHDDLAQLLTTLKIELTSYREKTDLSESTTYRSMDSIMLLINECIACITSIITELRPVILNKLGLIPALKQLFSEFQKHTAITCDLLLQENDFEINDSIALSLFRVVQEALANIRNHSNATYVMVKISVNSSIFKLIMKDNGRGITVGESTDPASFGIIGMKERISGFHGTITFKGIPGKGTKIKISVPLK